MRWLVCLGMLLAGCSVVKAPPNAGAFKEISTIHTAQVQYFSSYGRFAASLQELGPPASGSDTASAAGLIEHDLAGDEKGGYNYKLSATPAGYTILAAPDQYGATGNKTYFSDQGMGIHVHSGPEPATVDDPLQGETGLRRRRRPTPVNWGHRPPP